MYTFVDRMENYLNQNYMELSEEWNKIIQKDQSIEHQ
jgi:hypothetical protein